MLFFHSPHVPQFPFDIFPRLWKQLSSVWVIDGKIWLTSTAVPQGTNVMLNETRERKKTQTGKKPPKLKHPIPGT